MLDLEEKPLLRRPWIRNGVLGIGALGILIVVIVVWLTIGNSEKASQIDEEQGKKETAIDQAVANCEAIKQLGGICPADKEEIRKGEPPPPPYTDDQVRKIVNDSLEQFKRDNPDAVGLGEAKILEIVAGYVAAHPQPGRLPSDDQVRALIRQVIAGDTSLRGPPGAVGEPGADGATGPQGPVGEKGDKGDPGQTTCPVGWHFEERRTDELVCVADVVGEPG